MPPVLHDVAEGNRTAECPGSVLELQAFRELTGLQSTKPALSPAVGFDVTETSATLAAHAKIELLHVFIFSERRCFSVHHDPAIFQNIAIIRITQSHSRILLGQKECYAFGLRSVF